MSSLDFLLVGCSLSALAGTVLGSFTGLVPGLHPNSIAGLFSAFPGTIVIFSYLSLPFSSSDLPGPILFGCFLISVLLSHSMTEIIPTSMMGIADDDSISVLLPAQKLLSSGRVDLIIECSVTGAIGALSVFTLICLPIRFLMGSPIFLYENLEPIIGALLLVISSIVILSEGSTKRCSKAFLIFVLSGLLGIFVLFFEIPSMINASFFGDSWSEDPSIFFLPAFAGFFAVPSLLLSKIESHSRFLPSDSMTPNFSKVKAILSSVFPMALVGWIPGITNSYATTASVRFFPNRRSDLNSVCSYLVTYSATNIGGSLQAIVALATIFRARNGILESIRSELPMNELLWVDLTDVPEIILSIIWASVISILISSILFRLLAKKILSGKMNGNLLTKIRAPILFFIILLTVITSGPLGLLLLLSCFFAAVLAIRIRTSRVHLMGFLLIPVMCFFLL